MTRPWSLVQRAWAVVLVALFLVPVGLAVVPFIADRVDRAAAEKEAEKELASPVAKPEAWGVLGGLRLDQGRIQEALPLLQKAAAIEAARRGDARDTLAFAKANLDGLKLGIPSASSRTAEAALVQAQSIAEGLPQGRRAATWFSAGLFWKSMGRKAEAVRALSKAVALQPDDWVDAGGGNRFKSAGLSAYYQKMLAGALED